MPTSYHTPIRSLRTSEVYPILRHEFRELVREWSAAQREAMEECENEKAMEAHGRVCGLLDAWALLFDEDLVEP